MDALRASRDLLSRSAFDPSAGRNIQSEIEKSTTFVDKDGELKHVQLLDETKRNILTAFSEFTIGLNKKASAEQIKNEEDLFALRKGFEAAILDQRQRYRDETAHLDLATIDRRFAQETTLAGFTRDESLQRLSASGIGLTGDKSIRNALARVLQRQGIEGGYLTAAGANETEAAGREYRRSVGTATADRNAGIITEADFQDRLKVLNDAFVAQGQTLNDKFAHDLLTLQGDAAAQTLEIVSRVENERIDKFKSFAGGLFDSSLSGGAGLSKFVESQLQGVARTVFTNAATAYVYPELKKLIPHAGSPDSVLGKLFKDTPLAADPLKTAGITLNTAGTSLQAAADKLLAFGGSGGSPVGSGIASGASAISGGYASGVNSSNPFIFNNQPSDGNPILGTAPIGPNAPDLIMTGHAPAAGQFGNSKFAGKAAGVAAAAAGGFAAFGDFKTGGVKNDVAGVGALLGSAAGIAAATGVGAPVALGLGITAAATSFVAGLLPDPKKIREDAITKEIERNKYLAPTALNISQDGSGNYTDFDARGNLRTSAFRAVPTVSQPYTWWKGNTPYDVPGSTLSPFQQPRAPVIINHNYAPGAIQTMDAGSFHEFAQKNANAIGEATATHIQDRGESSRLGAAIQYVTR